MYGVPSGSVGDLPSASTNSAGILAQPVQGTQPTIVIPSAPSQPVPIGLSWNEIQTADGRVYYFNSKSNLSQWEKPLELQSSSERIVGSTDWVEYKIWDGRTYFHNPKTKCSVWSTPPEVVIAQKTASNDIDNIDQEILDYDAFEKQQKSHAKKRLDFFNLLSENTTITEDTTFDDAMGSIKDDIRFHALVSIETKRIFYASYISHLMKGKIITERDSKRELFKLAIHDFQHWSGMNESTTHAQMESHFKRREWFKKLDKLDIRKLFELYSLEYMEILKIKRQQLQDTYMQQLKSHILENQDINISSENLVEDVFRKYKYSDEPFWNGLTDSQKLIVIKSCISQRIRETKLALAAAAASTRA